MKARWARLGDSLTELRIYNMGTIDDAPLCAMLQKLVSLRILHLEHPAPAPKKEPRSYSVGSIATAIHSLRYLTELTLGFDLRHFEDVGFESEQSVQFMPLLTKVEKLTFIRVNSLRFEELAHANPANCAWKSLTVKECRKVNIVDLLLVLGCAEKLEHLDWRFPDEYEYDWEGQPLKHVRCRQLKYLLLENSYFSDQCLMRMFRVCAQLEMVALIKCPEITRMRPCASPHYFIHDCISFIPNLHLAFEECFQDVESIVLSKQRFLDPRYLRSQLIGLFQDAAVLRSLDLRQCQIGADAAALNVLKDLPRAMKVDVQGMSHHCYTNDSRLNQIPMFRQTCQECCEVEIEEVFSSCRQIVHESSSPDSLRRTK